MAARDSGDDEQEDGEYGRCALSLKVHAGPYFGEPSQYVTRYEGDVVSGDGFDETVGAMSLYVADLPMAQAEDHSTIDVLDSVDSTVAHSLSLISTRSGLFVPSVARIADSDLSALLILGSLQIDPAFRGHGLGLEAIEIACKRFSLGCSIAVLTAFPTQWEGRVAEGPSQFKRDRAKLMAYYSRAGFKPILDNGLMVRRLDY